MSSNNKPIYFRLNEINRWKCTEPKCPTVDKQFSEKRKIRGHVIENHQQYVQNKSHIDLKKLLHSSSAYEAHCQLCDKNLSSRSALIDHYGSKQKHGSEFKFDIKIEERPSIRSTTKSPKGYTMNSANDLVRAFRNNLGNYQTDIYETEDDVRAYLQISGNKKCSDAGIHFTTCPHIFAEDKTNTDIATAVKQLEFTIKELSKWIKPFFVL